ncbi:ATP-binding protein [Alteribacter keqinensis]|uniref:histidine kinase n=1 Tax=Alteribacter keqinensis TaxID=2483800 RepID=A0A3M7TN73_9BACI|nr:sensor histidine kinase [Alteribacter keqinensis]RNA67061.1 sensor histidine kinase [Alteribacter keqinensis]
MAEFDRTQMKKYISRSPAKISLKLRMTLLIGLLTVGMLAIIGVFFYFLLSDSLEQEMGERALGVSKSVAEIAKVRDAVAEGDPGDRTVQNLVEPIRQSTGAEFIVVGDINEIRYSHPNPGQIGERMVGEDSDGALIEGLSYISQAEGSLGPSIRGKTPLFSESGEIIGVVSVGFLVEDVRGVVDNYRDELVSALALIMALGLGGAILISIYIKKVLFGLEPEEISYLLLQKETILQSAHEGIIAVNNSGDITLLNKAAQRLLNVENEPLERYIGQPVHDLLPYSKLPEVLQSGESQYDEEMEFGEHIVVVNRVPLYDDGHLAGAVSTFRNKTEIERLTKELTKVREYAEGLRAQTHEFSNKLYTISGLLQLNQKQEAIDFIKKETVSQQKWIHQLIDQVADPMVSAILLGKLNEAHERGVRLIIDPESTLSSVLPKGERHALVTALGNVVDNAIDAVKHLPKDERTVSVFFTDLGDEVLFEIEDKGGGIPEELVERIYEQGFTTKDGEHRGFGLALSKRVLENVGGTMSTEAAGEEGTCFVITIPNKGEG